MIGETFHVDNLQDGYVDIVRRIVLDGDETQPRGQLTRELLAAKIVLSDPSRSVPVGIGRRVNPKIGMAESLQLIAGVSDAVLMERVTPTFGQFKQYDRFMGAYGPRIHRQMPLVIEELACDNDSRRGRVDIFLPDDLSFGSKDVPCTLTLQFMIRDGKLCMFTNMRSNDAVWGLTFDAWQFTALQHAVAYALGFPVGYYVHEATSLHVYVNRDEEIIDGLHAYDGAPRPVMPFIVSQNGRTGPREPHAAVAQWRMVVSGAESALGLRPVAASHHQWANLRQYRDKIEDVVAARSGEQQMCTTCRYVLPTKYFYDRVSNAARCSWCERDARYNVPVNTVAKMMVAQGGRCAVCATDLELKPQVDHSHKTLVVRGLLCGSCNRGLGHLRDDSELVARAASYLAHAESETRSWADEFSYLYQTQPKAATWQTS